jgi:hypothetical protein
MSLESRRNRYADTARQAKWCEDIPPAAVANTQEEEGKSDRIKEKEDQQQEETDCFNVWREPIELLETLDRLPRMKIPVSSPRMCRLGPIATPPHSIVP